MHEPKPDTPALTPCAPKNGRMQDPEAILVLYVVIFCSETGFQQRLTGTNRAGSESQERGDLI